ncbi:cyclic nucleotide-binding domain-containing protein [archaeon]|nr:MAG: cyclic nucleotide-binding domain-containing protein [archaeon]
MLQIVVFASYLGQAKAYFEEDLGPGEVFGEAALSGMHTRMLTAMSLTPLELIVVDDQDYMTAQDRDTQLMGTEERSRFLTEIPLFRDWDSYKLIRLAHALVQEEIPKQTVLCTHHAPNKDLYFIVHGKVDVVDNLEKKNVITSLLAHDYCGESGLINRFIKAVNKKVQEEFYAVATTRLDVLVLQEASFHLFDLASMDGLKNAFEAKLQWRKERVQAMRWERAKVRKQYYIMHCEAIMMENGLLKRNDENKTSHSESMLPALSPRHPPATASSSPAPSSSLLVPGQLSELIEEPASRPSSPLDMRPALAALRPLSPAKTNESPPARELSAVDQAYKTALVHPLDDRLQGDDVWRLPPPKAPPTIEELKDIPQLFAKDYDMLMLSSAIRDMRTLAKVQESVWMARKPTSAKKRTQFKQDIIVRFPVSGDGNLRPSTAKKRSPSPTSLSPTRDKTENHKDVDNFVQHDDEGDHPLDHIEGLRSNNNQDLNASRMMRHSFDQEAKEPEMQFFVKSLQNSVSALLKPMQSAPAIPAAQSPTAHYRPSTAPFRPHATAPPNALSQALIRMNSQKLLLDVEIPSTPVRKASVQNILVPLQTPPHKSPSKWSSTALMDANIAISKSGEERVEWGLLVQSMNLASQPQHRTAANSKSLSLGPAGRRSQSAQRNTCRIQAAQRLMVASRGPLVNKNSRLIQPPSDSHNVSGNDTIASMSEQGSHHL